MVLLLQLNGELPDRFPGHERRLYVFACRRKSCRRQEGSIRAIRGVRVSADAASISQAPKETSPPPAAPAAPKAATAGLGEALFGVKPATGGAARANPFASPSSSSTASSNPFAPKAASANPFAKPAAAPAAPEEEKKTAGAAPAEATKEAKELPETFAQKLALNNPQAAASSSPAPREPWPEESAQPKPYAVRWIADAEYEQLDPSGPEMPAQATANLPMEIDSGEGGKGGGKEDKDVFESSMDAQFQRFADRLAENPDQCIRYEYGGQPLLYSKTDKVGVLLHVPSDDGAKVKTAKGMPRCANCGANRTFEVQLTPQAIEELEAEEEDGGLDGMEWGTIIVGVCEKDCQERGVAVGEAGYVEEWAGVQWEELTVKR